MPGSYPPTEQDVHRTGDCWPQACRKTHWHDQAPAQAAKLINKPV